MAKRVNPSRPARCLAVLVAWTALALPIPAPVQQRGLPGYTGLGPL